MENWPEYTKEDANFSFVYDPLRNENLKDSYEPECLSYPVSDCYSCKNCV